LDARRFRADLYELATKACKGDEHEVRSKVFGIADILVTLYRKNLVKINHSALVLVCARGLIKQGYDVKVEHILDRSLVCDVIGTGGDGPLIVEIETGFIPPEAALEPSAYARARIASKIARYSRFAERFSLGTTPSYVLDIPHFFIKPPAERTRAEAEQIKMMTDVRYNKPAIRIEELLQARLDSIFLIDVDSATTKQLEPCTYMETASALMDLHRGQGLNPKRRPRELGFKLEQSAS